MNENSSLDTLVQLAYKENKPVLNDIAKQLKKKAVRLGQTYKLIWPLIDLHSELEKQYWQSYNCCREVIQEGNYLRSHYCNKRWCFECNAIRCAKMINGYKPIFDKFKDVQFVTLTRPNVKGEFLRSEVKDLVKTFQLMIRYLRRYKKLDIGGLRKLEITFNNKECTYHPHFHILVDSKESAAAILKEWLFRNPSASIDAQNIEPANAGSYTELFKYAAKIVAEKNTSIYAIDVIFQAIAKIRIYQPFGIKRCVSEDISEIYSQAVGNLDPEVYKVWRYSDDGLDWLSSLGQSLIETIKNYNSS